MGDVMLPRNGRGCAMRKRRIMQSDLLAYAASEVAQSDTYDCIVATVVCNMSARYCESFHRHMTRCRVADANKQTQGLI